MCLAVLLGAVPYRVRPQTDPRTRPRLVPSGPARILPTSLPTLAAVPARWNPSEERAMKGGKQGRKRRSADGGAARSDAERGERGKPRKGAAKRPAGGAPKKGSPKQPGHGGRPASGEE
jgi:hypothetical protein